MSMHPQPVGPVPEDTSRVARAAFPKGTTYLHMRDVLGAIYDDEDFAQLFEVREVPPSSRRGGWRWLPCCSSRRAFRIGRILTIRIGGNLDYNTKLSAS